MFTFNLLETMSTSSTAQITTEIVTAELHQIFCAEPPIITHTKAGQLFRGIASYIIHAWKGKTTLVFNKMTHINI